MQRITKIYEVITKTIKKIAGIWPSLLPKGTTELQVFSKDIFDTYSLPDFPSYYHAVATMIMHLGPDKNRHPKWKFARAVHKSMANQVAFEAIQKLKEQKDSEPIQN